MPRTPIQRSDANARDAPLANRCTGGSLRNSNRRCVWEDRPRRSTADRVPTFEEVRRLAHHRNPRIAQSRSGRTCATSTRALAPMPSISPPRDKSIAFCIATVRA